MDGLGVFQVHQAAELSGVDPITFGGDPLGLDEGLELSLHGIEAAEDFLCLGLSARF